MFAGPVSGTGRQARRSAATITRAYRRGALLGRPLGREPLPRRGREGRAAPAPMSLGNTPTNRDTPPKANRPPGPAVSLRRRRRRPPSRGYRTAGDRSARHLRCGNPVGEPSGASPQARGVIHAHRTCGATHRFLGDALALVAGQVAGRLLSSARGGPAGPGTGCPPTAAG